MTADQMVALMCAIADLQIDKQQLQSRVKELEEQLAAALAQST